MMSFSSSHLFPSLVHNLLYYSVISLLSHSAWMNSAVSNAVKCSVFRRPVALVSNEFISLSHFKPAKTPRQTSRKPLFGSQNRNPIESVYSISKQLVVGGKNKLIDKTLIFKYIHIRACVCVCVQISIFLWNLTGNSRGIGEIPRPHASHIIP